MSEDPRDTGTAAPDASDTPPTFSNPFPTLGSDETDGPALAEEDKDAAPAVSPEMEALVKTVAGISEVVEAQRGQNENMAQLITGLLSKANPAAAAVPAVSGVDLETNMPDPAEDQGAYNAEVQKRVNTALGSVAAHTDATTKRSTTLNDMWTQFRTDHPDLAKHPEIVESASRGAVAAAKAKGLDPSAAIFGDPAAFMADVAVRASSAIDRIRGASPPGGGQGERPDPEPTPTIDPEATRTGGVSGGSTEHPASGGSGKPKAKVTTFVDELKAIQGKSGFF